MDKSELRRAARARRDAFVADLSPAARARAFRVPPSPLARLFTPGQVVAAYRALGSEADPADLLRAAAERGCRIALPQVAHRAAPMRFLAWTLDDPLVPGPWGLAQPDDHAEAVTPDILLVPLLAFDRTGARLGQGAAFYDRALSLLPDALAVGLAWSVQEVAAVPVDPWDVPLDAVLTEREWIVP